MCTCIYSYSTTIISVYLIQLASIISLIHHTFRLECLLFYELNLHMFIRVLSYCIIDSYTCGQSPPRRYCGDFAPQNLRFANSCRKFAKNFGSKAQVQVTHSESPFVLLSESHSHLTCLYIYISVYGVV